MTTEPAARVSARSRHSCVRFGPLSCPQGSRALGRRMTGAALGLADRALVRDGERQELPARGDAVELGRSETHLRRLRHQPSSSSSGSISSPAAASALARPTARA